MKNSYLLSQSAFGRIVLHLECALQRPSHWTWHWHGIQRELSQLLAADAWTTGLSYCRQRAFQALIVVGILLLACSAPARGRSEKPHPTIQSNRILTSTASTIETRCVPAFPKNL